jgi:hypothetical protein
MDRGAACRSQRGAPVSVTTLLSRLEAVRQTGRGRWIARCPAHSDRDPSLSIRELEDGRILVHDFGGCGIEEVLGVVGLTFEALFPPRPLEHAPRERWRTLPSDVFEIARLEIAVVAVIAADMRKECRISHEDLARLLVSVERLSDIARSAYER